MWPVALTLIGLQTALWQFLHYDFSLTRLPTSLLSFSYVHWSKASQMTYNWSLSRLTTLNGSNQAPFQLIFHSVPCNSLSMWFLFRQTSNLHTFSSIFYLYLLIYILLDYIQYIPACGHLTILHTFLSVRTTFNVSADLSKM